MASEKLYTTNVQEQRPWSQRHQGCQPSFTLPLLCGLEKLLNIAGIHVFISKARMLWPTPYTTWYMQANSQTVDPGTQPSLLRSCSESGRRIKKIWLQAYEPWPPLPHGKILPAGEWAGRNSKGSTFSSSTHIKCQNSYHAHTAFYLEAKGSGLHMKKN